MFDFIRVVSQSQLPIGLFHVPIAGIALDPEYLIIVLLLALFQYCLGLRRGQNGGKLREMEADRGYWRILEADGVYAHLVDLLVDRTVVLSVPPRLLG